jgi:malonyl-CoA/methylmalonyl-CoA synthetase
VTSLFAATLASAPDKPVLFDDDRGWMAAGELEAESRDLAGSLAAAGLEAGDRILMSAGPSVALAVAHVAALRLGLVVVPMNTAYQAREISHVVEDSRPKAVVSDRRERARLVEEAAGVGAAGRSSPIVTIGIDGTAIRLPSGTGTSTSTSKPSLDQAEARDPALLVYTSGTTGRPKGALLSHGNLVESTEAFTTAWRWTPDDLLVLPLPLFHVHGLVVGLHGTLAAGGSVVVRSRFSAEDVGEAVGRHSATMLFGVPTIYARLTTKGRQLRRLRLCVSGSAPLPTDLHRVFEEASGQRILERYGMTETLMNSSNPYDGERRAGTVGLALPGVELRLDQEADDGAGEILVRGPNVFGGYWERPEATAAAFDGAWFRTGDLGRFDPDGYLRIVGRKTELVISGGFNVYPREVEDALREHVGVADAAVIGWPHPEWGEQVVAFVEPTAHGATVSEADLIAFAAERLAPYKRPKVIRVVAELPRNALGKVVKADLGPGAPGKP